MVTLASHLLVSVSQSCSVGKLLGVECGAGSQKPSLLTFQNPSCNLSTHTLISPRRKQRHRARQQAELAQLGELGLHPGSPSSKAPDAHASVLCSVTPRCGRAGGEGRTRKVRTDIFPPSFQSANF